MKKAATAVAAQRHVARASKKASVFKYYDADDKSSKWIDARLVCNCSHMSSEWLPFMQFTHYI